MNGECLITMGSPLGDNENVQEVELSDGYKTI
jgi:hypothetical protein